ncbi:hypothetical protein Barb6_00505 [Bacteroidales bacterium Barb6]|nr:hypothetical protein Barb6_00505 [Bacteroidales bacterium Barb6]
MSNDSLVLSNALSVLSNDSFVLSNALSVLSNDSFVLSNALSVLSNNSFVLSNALFVKTNALSVRINHSIRQDVISCLKPFRKSTVLICFFPSGWRERMRRMPSQRAMSI